MGRRRKPAHEKAEVIWPTSVRLPPHLRADLEQAAADERRTLTFTITEILLQWQAFWRARKKAKIKPSEGAKPEQGNVP